MMATAAVITSLRDLERVRGVGRKLAGRSLSLSQRTDAVKQALGTPVFAARGFVPKEDRSAGANVPLPGGGGASPLEWRWGQLGEIAYQEVDVTVKQGIADGLFARLRDVKDPVTEGPIQIHGTRHAFDRLSTTSALKDSGARWLSEGPLNYSNRGVGRNRGVVRASVSQGESGGKTVTPNRCGV
jgi:hypothetical protein